MRAVHRDRHQKIRAALASDFAACLTVIPSSAGLDISAVAKKLSVEEIDAFAETAADAGVAIQPLSMFAVADRPVAGIALGYGAIPESRIDEGLNRLQLLLP